MERDLHSYVSIEVVALLLTLHLEVVWSANILAFFVVSPMSHIALKSTLLKELASRGHRVTVVSPVAEKDPPPNYEEITVDKVPSASAKYGDTIFKKEKDEPADVAFFIWDFGRSTCESILQLPEIQQLIHSRDRHYDLLILEAYFGDCYVPFSKIFDVPIIKVSIFCGTPWMTDWLGNPTDLSYMPDPFLNYSDKMTFWQRLVNVLTTSYYRLARKYYHMPKIESIVRRYFNESGNLPPVTELEVERTSLLFVNSHFSIHYPRPLLPSIIQIGGLHLKPPKKLPQNIQMYLDEAKHGVIYFSMGSVIRSSNFPEEKREAFLEAFSQLKEKVLWKWETDYFPGKPENVKLCKWLPQTDILAHPNVKAFMTHGGQMSLMEAVHRGVPTIGIPVFGDQSVNTGRTKVAETGVAVDFHNVSVESITWALREVLDNSKYRDNAQRMSLIFRDQPLTPLQQAVYWTEYVIRHKGAPHMRSAALDLTWYQYFLIDVIAVLAVAVFITLTLLYVVFKYFYIQLLRFIGNTNSFYSLKKKCQ